MPKINDNSGINAEINELRDKLRRMSANSNKRMQSIYKRSAQPLIQEIQVRAPESDQPHSRSVGGEVVATYYPGNLKRSFKILIFNQSPAVFVGPNLNKSNPRGDFKGIRTDAYYAHWMEFGAPGSGIKPGPFVRPAVQSAGPAVLEKAVTLLKNEIEKSVK